jgi:hypothetical protein
MTPGDGGVDEHGPAGEHRPGVGRPVSQAGGPEPGNTYFTALGKWPESVGMSRTVLAGKLGCAESTLSALLGNKGPRASTPKALDWARKIIKACRDGDQDLANWAAFHHEVQKFEVGAIKALPPPPEPGKAYALGLSRPPESSGSDSKLRRLSERFAVELDLASSQRLDSDPHRLSAGLYVRRTQQDVVLNMLRPADYDKPVLVHGIAGEGKSSLLWGLYEDLKNDPTLDAYLLNSPWLASVESGAFPVSADELRQVTDSARENDRVAVFLIDTVDLLLHDELHRQQVLDICELVTEAGAEVVLTSRPEEALTLPRASFRTVGLQPYDDIELPQAVGKHAAAFCPDVLPGPLDEKIRLILDSAARGLTVREIVMNPLKLRLLFELYQPDFPSLEHDVSSLYGMYWKRRVRTDQRGEAAIPEGTDLSRPAEHTAIALLAAGRIELGERLLSRSAASVAANWHSGQHSSTDCLPDSEAAISNLTRRGVLIRSVQAIRFFHQTMFEYAAARGLLARDDVRALRFLVDHLKRHPDDLFVGAVVEQMLILSLDDLLVAHAAAPVLEDLVVSGIPSLQRIALGVLAHQPTPQETTEQLIEIVDTAALRRYAQTVPTVAKVDVGLQMARLTRVWRRHESVRESVLEAMARLGARNPAIVVSTLRELDCVRVALTWKDNPARMVRLVARVLVAAASADPVWTLAQLLVLFDHTTGHNTHRNVPLYLVDLIADAWPVLGSPQTATVLQDRIVHSQQGHDAAASEMRKALGRIQALAWRDRLQKLPHSDGSDGVNWWMEVVEELCGHLEEDFYEVFANARLHAIAELAIDGTLGTELVIRTIKRFSTLGGPAPFALSGLFARLLAADSHSHVEAPVRQLVIAMLGGLPAPGNRPPEGPPRWAHVVRKALREAGLTANQLATLLIDLPVAQNAANWLADGYLAVLLVPAAAGGHPHARAALDQVTEDAELLSATGQKNVSYDIVRYLHEYPRLLPLLINLSVWRKSATPLSDVIPDLDGELLTGIRAQTERLTELVDALFDGKGAAQKEAMSLWRRLYNVRAMPSPDHDALMSRFKATPALAARGNILELAADAALDGGLSPSTVARTLRDLFDVDHRTQAIVSPGTGKAGHVAITARAAWLRLTCQHEHPGEVDFDELLGIATARPVTVDTLAVLGYLMSTLARQGKPSAATDLLIRVAVDAVRSADLSIKQENTPANKLRPAMRSIFRVASVEDQRALLAKAPILPMKHARVLVAAAAQENFHTLRPQLAALLEVDLPQGVAQQIHDDVRVRSRSAARGALPNLLLPLPDPGQV